MKIHFLGTGAADWDMTQHSTAINFRRYSSVIIDDELLIDAGPCLFEFMESFAQPSLLDKLQAVLQTHSHGDHFSPATVARLGKVPFYADRALEHKLQNCSLEFKATEFFIPYICNNYTIIALPANHFVANNPQEKPRHYIIKKEDKCLYYGLDGAWLLNPSYKELSHHQFDLMIFDATFGDIEGDMRIFEHNNLIMVEQMAAAMRKNKILKDNGKIIISHMARMLHGDHASLCCRMEKSGIEVAYDNVVFEVI